MKPSIEAAIFEFHGWRRELSNFSMIKHRHCDGHIVSMHQSGTHWLKFMLANAMAWRYGIPEPVYNHANDIIGGPKDPVIYPNIPRIISSHTIPHVFLRFKALRRALDLPPYVLLIRDIRFSLVSNFVKWEQRYKEPFSVFLAGDPAGHRYNSDIWWCIRFLNAWGRIHRRMPSMFALIRYEDLVADTAGTLKKVSRHLRLPLDDAALRAGVAAAGKDAMAMRDDPARPPGAVRKDPRDPLQRYSDKDREMIEQKCRRYLKYDFGYDYSDWSCG